MHVAGIHAANPLTNVVSQAVTGIANRASSAVKGFESDLQSGNLSGAPSFLSALQQGLTTQGPNSAEARISSQISQVSSDLQSGNLTAAQADFSNLQLTLAQTRHTPNNPSNPRTAVTTPAPVSSSSSANASLAALESYNSLDQNAFNTALNLSLPASVPSLSINS